MTRPTVSTDPAVLFTDSDLAGERRGLAERWRAAGLHTDETLGSELARAALEPAAVAVEDAAQGWQGLHVVQARRQPAARAHRDVAKRD